MGAQLCKHLAVCQTLTAGKAWWSCFKRRQTTNYLWYTVILTGAWAATSVDSNLVVLTKRGVHQIIQGRAPAFRLRVGQILACDSEAWKSLTHQLCLPQFDAIVCGRCFTKSKFLLTWLTELPSNPKPRRGEFQTVRSSPPKIFCVVLTIWRQARPHKTFIIEISNHDILKPPSTVNNPNTTRIRALELRWISNHRACNLFAYLSQAQCLERWSATSQLFTPLSQHLYEHQGLT